MEPKISYNYDFLNSHFTSKEFNFINNANLECKNLDSIINKENELRDVIVNFINNLNNSISSSENNKDEISKLATDAQQIFEKINDSIRTLQNLKLLYLKISVDIAELLIKIEANSNNQVTYEDKVREIKDIISTFETEDENTKEKVLLNGIMVNTFLQNPITKKYISNFDIDFHITSNDSNSTSEDHNTTSNITEDTSSNTDNTFSNAEKIDSSNDNPILLVSEKLGKVFLPYTQNEISLYLNQFPNEYSSLEDVVNKEFVLPFDYYTKHPVVSRFRETYSLIRDRESMSVIDALKYALEIMFRADLNPVVIAACKTQEQLENYISCLENNNLNDFKDFEIKFEVNPI